MSVGDQSKFTSRLRARLASGQQSIIVDIDKPFPPRADAPALLAPWLNEVKATGGSITIAQYCQDSRGFFSFLKKLFGGGEADGYAAAARYDAVLHLDGLDQVVTQVQFKRRAAP